MQNALLLNECQTVGKVHHTGKMHENWCSVQTQKLEYVWAFIKIDHSKEKLIAVCTGVSVWVCGDGKLIMSMTTNNALPSRCLFKLKVNFHFNCLTNKLYHCCEHYDHGVVSRGTLYKIFKFVAIELKNRSLHVHVQQLLYFII